VRSIDIAPTVLAFQKASFPAKIQGVSLAALITSSQKIAAENSYFESLSMHLNAQWAPLRGFYSENYQYIDLPVPELYDLSNDPKESKNLCESNKQLCGKFAARYYSFADAFLKRTVAPAKVDSETAEQLQALGYVSGSSVAPKKHYGPEDDPKLLITYHNRVDAALGFYNRGNDAKAMEILKQIIAERPDYSIAYMHASFIESEQGEPEKAAAILRDAIHHGIMGSDVDGKMGLYLYQSGNYDEAISHLKTAVKEDSRDIDNLNYLGMAYTASGNYSEADAIFRKAAAVDPSDGMTLNNIGTLYLTQKRYGPAIQSLEQAIAKNPHIASAYNGLGVAYASQNNWDLAIKNWSAALRENEKNYDAMLNLAYAYLEKKDRAKALELFQTFEKNAPVAHYSQDLTKVRSLIRQLQ